MENNIEDNYNHTVNLYDRKTISLSGIKKINHFDENEFYIESILGPIIIKGEQLELIKIDTFKGNLNIKGKINSLNYLEENKKIKTDNIMARLFK